MTVRILAYSYFPPLVDHNAGGVQGLVNNLLRGLTESGHEVTVLCPELSGGELISMEKLRVHPILKESVNRPLYPHEHLHNLRAIGTVAHDADIIWSIDREFPLDVPQPIILTLQTVC